MRRTLILLALVLCAALIASCGKGDDLSRKSSSAHATTGGSTTPKTASTTSPNNHAAPETGASPSKQRALAFAHAVNLTAEDVPGFTASEKHDSNSASEKRLERQMLQCTGLGGAGEQGAVEQGSADFHLKRRIVDLSVSSEVSVQPSAAQAKQGLAAIRSAHVRGCFSRYLTQIFQSEKVKGATPGPVTVQSGTPPAPGTSGGFGLRVTATFDVHGIKVPIYLDFLGFVDGASEVTLTSSGLLRPFPASVQQHLFALLLARAKAHPL